MRKCRTNLHNRCYHLISRVAHRAFFLDADERTWLTDLIQRTVAFSGVKLMSYSVIMSNHFTYSSTSAVRRRCATTRRS